MSRVVTFDEVENKIITFTGRDLCARSVGWEKVEREGLDGDCDNCKYLDFLGVHSFCNAATYLSPRITSFDCAVTRIRSEKDKDVRCLNCDRHLNPKIVRCEECLKTPELVNFKEWKPGKSILNIKNKEAYNETRI